MKYKMKDENCPNEIKIYEKKELGTEKAKIQRILSYIKKRNWNNFDS